MPGATATAVQAAWEGIKAHVPAVSLAAGRACVAAPASILDFWLSPWWLLLPAILLVVTVPAGWAYWLVAGVDLGGTVRQRLLGRMQAWGAWLFVVAATLAFALAGQELKSAWTLAVPYYVVPYLLCAFVAALATAGVFAIAWRRAGAPERAPRMRRQLTVLLASSLQWFALVAGFVVVDSLAQALYLHAVAGSAGDLGAWLGGGFAALAAVAAAARRIAARVRDGARVRHAPLPAGAGMLLAALMVPAVALVVIDAAALALTWSGGPLCEASLPRGAAACATSCALRDSTVPASLALPVGVLLLLAIVGALIGRTWTFLNDSTLQPLYWARLARAYLGASNPRRNPAYGDSVRTVDPVAGDDAPLAELWWQQAARAIGVACPVTPPEPPVPDGPQRESQAPPALPQQPAAAAWNGYRAGAPLHYVNVTVNETLVGRTGMQNRDRKGIGLAVGPFGLSAGIRHHAVCPAGAGHGAAAEPLPGAASRRVSTRVPGDGRGWQVFPRNAYAMFHGGPAPEPLSLGQWLGISGAAFSTGLGMRTNLARSLLAGFFNVRLGYWWDSGGDPGAVVSSSTRHPPRGAHPPPARPPGPPLASRLRSLLAHVFPVQMHLLDELTARFVAAQRRWYLSDGGHFENLGAYELIRRRLPLIVVVDAEQDADYRFEGLGNLVRKARLDFAAEISFLDTQALSRLAEAARGCGQPDPQATFGSLDALRRGGAAGPPGPWPEGMQPAREDRDRLSARCAALATVTYDGAVAPSSLLVYLKPVLLGDECADILHYRLEHADFPHEPTADQSFGEDQWESYRRLGELVGTRVLGAGFDPLHALLRLLRRQAAARAAGGTPAAGGDA